MNSENKYLLLISVGPKIAKFRPRTECSRLASSRSPTCAASLRFVDAPLRSNRDRRWVSPFGNSRIKACSRLPMTYRSVPRPSSPFSPRILTDLPAARLAPSGLRPNALPLHNVRDRGPEERRRTGIPLAGHLAFVTLSACAPNETDKLHRIKDRKLQSARHFAKTF